MLAEPSVQWVTASPLWNTPQQTPAQIQQPAILRFASDTFMEDLAQQLQKAPQGLSNYQAIRESFRELLPGETGAAPPPPAHLKLYQPTHGHFCLITANLVCRIVGLPDKAVDTTRNERVGFIVRRRLSEDNPTEFAWVSTSEMPIGKTWRQLQSGTEQTLAEQEELLPLFPINFVENRQHRRLLIGLIPTSSRETFKAAATTLPSPFDTPAPTPPTEPPKDPRMDEFQSNVIDLIKLHLQAPRMLSVGPPPPPADVQQKIIDEQNKSEQEASLFVLLDCATFLARYPSPGTASLWTAIYTTTPPEDSAGRALYNLLRTSHINGGAPANESRITWQKALQTVWDLRNVITGLESGPALPPYNLRYTTIDLANLQDTVQRAIGPYQAPTHSPANDLVPLPKLNSTGVGTPLFSLRCVYQRTRCGAVQNVVSEASVPFEIASFFDFDAPARPIRISLPVDTNIASLRKYKKNVSFVISNKLRQQMESVTDLKRVMDGNIASGQEFDLGVICSFAIPIITICAMLVLMIFLVLLNIVFWWLPFIRICFPIPLIHKK